MNITIKTIGGQGKSIIVQVDPSDNVATLKRQIYKSEGIPADQQVLIYCGKKLKDECMFSEYNIQKDSTVHLALKAANDVSVQKITQGQFSKYLFSCIPYAYVCLAAKLMTVKLLIYM